MAGPITPYWAASAHAISGALIHIAANKSTHTRVALSGISSSISLACWIVLLLPQLIEQWRLKSSEGISPIFIGIWFIGDLCNLSGSIWAGLLPGVILLAFWFCFTDALMFFSYFYYKQSKFQNHHHVIRRRSTFGHQAEEAGPIEYNNNNNNNNNNSSSSSNQQQVADPSQPLLGRRDSVSSQGPSTYTEPTAQSSQPASTRRKSSKKQRRDSLASIIDAPSTSSNVFQQYLLPILFVIAAGVVGYLFSDQETEGQNPGNDDGSDSPKAVGPEILGYLSAVLYLGARIPQIIQNYQKKSVYGLSLLFFLFSIMGNISYAGGILFYCNDWEYVKVYLPWLLGSLGTVSEDIIIIIQFFVYGAYVAAPNDSAILEE
ncbi:uncharacterized protein SAPINGB_P001834 [Magnusiomyces paraingens]|uniref:Vacuolar membrane PQ loop repeat protein n=1 Tax=Magnusiomyces paraingens TaxID=2606893 RepID=A0A5E8BBG1_9ASCO|nr:uncharacterized protein SAPINGB_P001834 [Saprochaete ingens]VVT48551.1 unnamed protein product [Saprochaete ingens]